MPLISTHGLNVRFGGVHAVRDVEFIVDEGDLRCIIGPNGAGKSTFFKLLTGQLKPTSGRVLYRETEITGLSPHAIARIGIGIKTQTPSVFDGLSIYENIWLSASRHSAGQHLADKVDHVLTRIGLADIARQDVGRLAHGQRQWVELGIVLASDVDLILLDEPVAGMTHAETLRTIDLIREINKTTTLIVVEHDMDFVRQVARSVSVFDQGAMFLEGKPDAVLSDARVRDIYLGKKVKA